VSRKAKNKCGWTCFSRQLSLHFVSLRPETHDVVTRVSGRVTQSTELDIVNGSFCNLCALVLGLALHIFAAQCWRVPRRTRQLSTVAIFLSYWCLETSCSLLFVFIYFLADQISCRSYVGSVYRMRSLAVSGFSKKNGLDWATGLGMTNWKNWPLLHFKTNK